MKPPSTMIQRLWLLAIALFIGACSATPKTPTIDLTDLPTEAVQPVDLWPVVENAATPEIGSRNPRELTLCVASYVALSYVYSGTWFTQDEFLSAVAPHPIEFNNFQYTSTMLHKLPSLEAGDATIQTVSVRSGDSIVDGNGDVVVLEPGVAYQPSGCRDENCLLTYTGGDVQMDQMEAVFRLRPDLKWSDGTPLTARDSVYAFKFPSIARQIFSDIYLPLGLPVGAAPGAMERTASYKALDDHTIQWVGYPGFVNRWYFLNFLSPLPQHLGEIHPNRILDPDPLIGWGPFRVREVREGEYVRLERNPYYHRIEEDLPKLDNILIKFIDTGTGHALAAVMTGECDVTDYDSLLQGARFSWELFPLSLGIKERGDIQIAGSPGFWEGIAFNFQSTYFNDPNIRQAIILGTDREKIANAVIGDISMLASGYLAQDHPLYPEDVNLHSFSPDRARELLAEAGWSETDSDGILNKGGQSFVIKLYTSLAHHQRAVGAAIFQQNMAEIGISVQLSFLKSADLFAENGPLALRHFDLYWGLWPEVALEVGGNQPACTAFLSDATPFPDQIGQWDYLNVMGYNNPEFDVACMLGLHSLDPSEADRSHRLAQQIYFQDPPVVPLYFLPAFALAKPEVEGLNLERGKVTSFESLGIETEP